MPTFHPIASHVVLRLERASAPRSSGLVLPDVSESKPYAGTVVAVGPDVDSVELGDLVAFAKYAGTAVRIDDVDHLIVREADLLGVLEPDEFDFANLAGGL